MDIKGGVITYSRSSTPATMAATRPERDFVRNRNKKATQAGHEVYSVQET